MNSLKYLSNYDFHIKEIGERKIIKNSEEFISIKIDSSINFIYIVKGSLESKDRIYKDNTLFILSPNKYLKVKGNAQIYYFTLYENILNFDSIKEFQYTIRDKEECKKCFENIFEHAKDSSRYFYVASMIYRILDLINFDVKGFKDRFPIQIKKHIDNNLDCSREDLRDNFSNNPDYIERVFKNEFNKTITQYKNELKCNKAKYYLEFTKLSISDVAEKSFFSSENQFRVVFKRVVGMSPKEYRKGKILFKEAKV